MWLNLGLPLLEEVFVCNVNCLWCIYWASHFQFYFKVQFWKKKCKLYFIIRFVCNLQCLWIYWVCRLQIHFKVQFGRKKMHFFIIKFVLLSYCISNVWALCILQCMLMTLYIRGMIPVFNRVMSLMLTNCWNNVARFLPEASFGLRVLSLPASVRVGVNHELVRAITCHWFQLESPNLNQTCKTIWLRSLLFWGLIDLDLQGQI